MNNPFETIEERLVNIERLLHNLHQPVESSQRPRAETEDLVTVDQAAEFLNLANQTIYGLVCRKEIPYYKRGKRLYFSKDLLLQWVKDGPGKS